MPERFAPVCAHAGADESKKPAVAINSVQRTAKRNIKAAGRYLIVLLIFSGDEFGPPVRNAATLYEFK